MSVRYIEKDVLSVVIFILEIKKILYSSNDLDLFLEVFVYGNDMNKTKAEIKYHITNYHRWLNSMNKFISLIEEKIDLILACSINYLKNQ